MENEKPEIVDENGRPVTKVVPAETKEGFGMKIKDGFTKHKKLVIGGIIAGSLFVGAKVIKAFRSAGSGIGDGDSDDDFDDDFDYDDDLTDPESTTDSE